jgi:opacity protein-like surface antigen
LSNLLHLNDGVKSNFTENKIRTFSVRKNSWGIETSPECADARIKNFGDKMSQMRKFAAVASGVLLLLIAASSARAQDIYAPRVEAIGSFSWLDIGGTAPRIQAPGFNASFVANFDSVIGVETDFGVYSASNLGSVGVPQGSTSFRDYSFAAGPRVRFPHGLFFHGLLGADHATGTGSLVYLGEPLDLSTSSTTVGATVGGGIEVPVVHHLALMGEGDYVVTQFQSLFGAAQKDFRVSGGLALHFGTVHSRAN